MKTSTAALLFALSAAALAQGVIRDVASVEIVDRPPERLAATKPIRIAFEIRYESTIIRDNWAKRFALRPLTDLK